MERKNFRYAAGANGFTVRGIVVSLVVLVAFGGAATAVWLLAREAAEEPAVARPTRVETTMAGTDYQPPSDEGYVGSETCAQCHAEIAETFKTHPMSRSITLVDPNAEDATVPREETRISGEKRVYESEVRDGVMLHHEMMFDASGELIYDQALPVAYVVGSGRRAKAYLHQRGDLLFMSPLNWYSEAKRWDMAPGYTPEDPRRFSRRVTDDCLGCHAGRIDTVGRSLNKYETPAFHEMAIGCENCHGPGERHVALHESGLSGTKPDPIVNPADLGHAERESVCYQCHLLAEVRLPRYGRSELDFRPGMKLEDIWAILDAGSDVTGDGRTRSVNHVQQMRESRCYIESDGRFGCISCHDPHRVPSEAERVEFYRQKCFTCHDDSSCTLPIERRQEKEDSCIACHMPARESNNISHVTQTDHRVIRTPTASPEEPNAEPDTLVFFDRMDRRLEPWERDRSLALGAWMYLNKSGRSAPANLAQLLLGVTEVVPDDGTAHNVLAAMASRNGLTDLARAHYEAAKEIPSAEEAALSGLLDIYYSSADWRNALECSERLIEIDPYDAKVYALRADILISLGRTSEGIESAERALELNPTLIPVREWLAAAYRDAGRPAEQREQEEILRRMRDARPPAPPPRNERSGETPPAKRDDET